MNCNGGKSQNVMRPITVSGYCRVNIPFRSGSTPLWQIMALRRGAKLETMMFNHIHGRTTCTILLLGSTFLAGPPAQADDKANIKSMSFDTESVNTEIHVISTDGKTWDKLQSGTVQFWGHLKIKTKGSGYVSRVGVALGQCGENQCVAMPEIWSAGLPARDFDRQANFNFPTSLIPIGDADSIPVTPEGNQMLKECNKHLQPDGPTKPHHFNQTFKATFAAETGKAVLDKNMVLEASPDTYFPDDVDYWRTASFSVKVSCDIVKTSHVTGVASNQGDFKTEDVKLFLATVTGANTDGPNPGTTCPALRVTTRVQTSKAGPVDIRLWRQAGKGAITSEFKSAMAHFKADKNGYFADFVHSEIFDATSWLQFKADVVGDAFAPQTPWKDITVHCTGAGGGGLASDQPDHGDAPVLPPKKPKRVVDTGSDNLTPQTRPNPDRKPPPVSILCKPGFDLKGKRCIRKPAIIAACQRTEIRINGTCVKKPVISVLCAKGFRLVGRACLRVAPPLRVRPPIEQHKPSTAVLRRPLNSRARLH